MVMTSGLLPVAAHMRLPGVDSRPMVKAADAFCAAWSALLAPSFDWEVSLIPPLSKQA